MYGKSPVLYEPTTPYYHLYLTSVNMISTPTSQKFVKFENLFCQDDYVYYVNGRREAVALAQTHLPYCTYLQYYRGIYHRGYLTYYMHNVKYVQLNT